MSWAPSLGGDQPPLIPFTAIWDTGATNSAITQNVVDACGLVATGIAQVHGVSGSSQVETYLVNLGLPDKVIFYGVRVTKAQLPGADILIGMDIIVRGDFAVTNFNGATKFSFRVPSMASIDYATETVRRQQGNRAERRGGKERQQQHNWAPDRGRRR